MLAEVTALATTDVARDIHLCTRLGEWEVAWAKTNLGVCAKHLSSEGQEHLLQIGEAYVLIDIKTFYLVEEAVGTGTDGLVAIYTSWAEYTDRRLVGLHVVSLITGGVAAEEDVLGHIARVALLDEEGVLHIAGWMVGSEVEHRKHVLVIVYLRTMVQGESHAREYVDNLVLNNGQWVTSTQGYWVSCASQVDVVAGRLSLFHLLLECVDALCGCLLELVDLDADGFLLVCWHSAEICHEGVDLTFLAQILQAKLLYFLCVLRRKCAHFLQ